MAAKRNDSIELLADALAGALAARSPRPGQAGRSRKGETKAVRFARGLAIGALVGAAVTGFLRHRSGRGQDRPGPNSNSGS